MGTYSSVPRRQYPTNASLLPNYGGQATHFQSSPATSYGPSNSIDNAAAPPNSPFALTLQDTQTGAAPNPRYPSASPQQAQLPYRGAATNSMPQRQYYGTSASSGREDAYYNPAVALRYGSLTRSSTTSSDSFETRSTAASSFTSYDADTVYARPSRASSKYDQK